MNGTLAQLHGSKFHVGLQFCSLFATYLYFTHSHFGSISYQCLVAIVKLHNDYFVLMSYCSTLVSIPTISDHYQFANIKQANRNSQERCRCRYCHIVYDFVDINIHHKCNATYIYFRFDNNILILFMMSPILT